MSRYSEGDEDPGYNNSYELWQANVQRALKGKRGQAALRDLRDALMALPQPRLIERALCTVSLPAEIAAMPVQDDPSWTNWRRHDLQELVDEQGMGVCAVGAYVWWQKVKAGMDPEAAFAALPAFPDTETDLWETQRLGQQAGLAGVLAWELAYRNDETYESMTPEDRHAAFLRWIDKQLSSPGAAEA